MESMSAIPSDPSADLAAAESARQRLTGALRMPSWFYTTLGVGTAVQIGCVGYGLSDDASGPRLLAVGAGLVVFVAVTVVLLQRFRRLNRVRVDGFFSRVLMGTSTWSSLALTAGMGGAVWAGLVGQWWLLGLASVAGGVGYAASARLWWRDYLADPATHSRGESRMVLFLIGLVALVALVALADLS
jgi:hypothetical protein